MPTMLLPSFTVKRASSGAIRCRGPKLLEFPIQCLHGFVRIITNPNLGSGRLAMLEALDIVGEWLELPQVQLLIPTARHWPMLRAAIAETRAVGPFVSNVAIAVTVMEHGATLYTNDRGIARIPGLRWQNPLKR
jgi:predicted nucleic acid-binding protein